MHNSIIEKVAQRLNGKVRPIANGLSVELVQDRLPFIMEIKQTNENLITASAWLQSLPVPKTDQDWMMLAFYLGTVNSSNMTTGKMRWNEQGGFGFQSKILFDNDDPEFALTSAVDRTYRQAATFAPGLKNVRSGEPPDVVVVRSFDLFLSQPRPEKVSPNSPEHTFITRWANGIDCPREPSPGGVALTSERARIEVSADESGCLLVRAIGPRVCVESDSWNSANFYPPLANSSNRCFGTLYLHEFDRLASRCELFFRKGQMPSRDLLAACVQSVLSDVSCHTAGMQLVARGEDVMTALRLAYSKMRSY